MAPSNVGGGGVRAATTGIGAGFGAGSAYSDCQRQVQHRVGRVDPALAALTFLHACSSKGMCLLLYTTCESPWLQQFIGDVPLLYSRCDSQ